MKSGIRLAIGLLLVVSLTITMTACSSSGYAPEGGTTTVVVHHGYGYGPGWGGGWGGYYPGGGVVIGGPVIYH